MRRVACLFRKELLRPVKKGSIDRQLPTILRPIADA